MYNGLGYGDLGDIFHAPAISSFARGSTPTLSSCEPGQSCRRFTLRFSISPDEPEINE